MDGMEITQFTYFQQVISYFRMEKGLSCLVPFPCSPCFALQSLHSTFNFFDVSFAPLGWKSAVDACIC